MLQHTGAAWGLGSQAPMANWPMATATGSWQQRIPVAKAAQATGGAEEQRILQRWECLVTQYPCKQRILEFMKIRQNRSLGRIRRAFLPKPKPTRPPVERLRPGEDAGGKDRLGLVEESSPDNRARAKAARERLERPVSGGSWQVSPGQFHWLSQISWPMIGPPVSPN